MNIYHLIPAKQYDLEVHTAMELALRQREEGNYVEIVCRGDSEIYAAANRLEFPVSTLNFNGIGDLDSAVRFARIIRRRRNCLVFAHTFRVAFTACMARAIAENKQMRITLMRHVVKAAKHSMLFRKLYREIDSIIFPSAVAMSRFMAPNVTVNPKKVKLIHWSVPPIRTKGINLYSNYNIPAGRKIISYASEVKMGNGLRSLLRALSQLTTGTWHLIVLQPCASARYMRMLREIIVSNNMEQSITFANVTNTFDLVNIAASAHIGVVPAVGRLAWPPQALGYMSHGVPVVIASNGAQADYIDNGNTGLLVNENNPYSLAEALQKIVSDNNLRDSIARNGKAAYQNLFNYDKFASEINRHCEDLLRNNDN